MEASPAIEVAKHTLLSGGLILAIGTVTGFVAQKCKIPDVAIFLIVGIAIGPQALGLIDIKADSALYQIILLFGASYILFDGGASLRLNILKRVWITIVVIATDRRADHRGDHRLCRACRPRRCPGSWRCCSARRSPRPTRRRWCRFSARSKSATAWRRR